ncbi:hypothetical protein HDR60_03055 [bacterium]|nr:hypothetical protein [bacterium]
MAYANKSIDHEKRKNQEGSYSPYNHIYSYLMTNYEPGHNFTDADKRLMLEEYVTYCTNGGSDMSHARDDIIKAIDNFKNNNEQHGDTGRNFGKKHESSFDVIKKTMSDLRW